MKIAPTTVLVKFVLYEIREGKHETKAVVISNDGKKLKIPSSNIESLGTNTPRATAIRAVIA